MLKITIIVVIYFDHCLCMCGIPFLIHRLVRAGQLFALFALVWLLGLPRKLLN